MKQSELRLVAWEMTRTCNLACVHCRAGASTHVDPDELTTAEGKKLVDEIAQVGKPILIMTGGEPLLRSDFFELAAYARDVGLRPVLATNGVLVDAEMAARIARVGIPRVSISLDGPTAEEHDEFRKVSGAFRAALDGVANLRAHSVGVQINTTLTKRNRAALRRMVQMAEDIGAVAFHVFLLVPTGRAKDMAGEEMNPAEYEETLLEFYEISRATKLETKATCAPQYYRIMRQQAKAEGIEVTPETFGLNAHTRGCLGGISFVFVSHTGTLQPCGYFDVQAENVRDKSFGEIWRESELFLNLRNFSKLEGKCGKCGYVRFCGGCRARAYEHTGNYLAQEPYCAYAPPACR